MLLSVLQPDYVHFTVLRHPVVVFRFLFLFLFSYIFFLFLCVCVCVSGLFAAAWYIPPSGFGSLLQELALICEPQASPSAHHRQLTRSLLPAAEKMALPERVITVAGAYC